MSTYYLLIISSILALLGCSPTPEQNRDNYKEEMLNRKITRVTDAQINIFVQNLSNKIFDTLNKNTDSSLISAISKKYNCSIVQYKDTSQISSPKLKAVYQAYLYQLDNALELNDNIQKLDEQTIAYTHPTVDENKFLTLHTILYQKKSIILNFTDKPYNLLP
jgi:PBP1b-binding outer membrane lipoprotein LpoB